jgi:hypothetical protein
MYMPQLLNKKSSDVLVGGVDLIYTDANTIKKTKVISDTGGCPEDRAAGAGKC